MVATTNKQFMFEHYFPKADAERDDNGKYTHPDTALLFQGFELVCDELTKQEQGHKMALNVKQQLVNKLEGDVADLKRKIARLESDMEEQLGSQIRGKCKPNM